MSLRLAAAIVCLPRSGSHMLASCLESHPAIGSYGEFVNRRRAVPFPTRPLPIGIIMYYQWERALADGVEVERVIHLLRDPRFTALSHLQNRLQRERNGAAHRAHAKRGEPLPQSYAVDPAAIAPLAAEHAAMQAQFRERLRDRQVLEVHYEALTQNCSVSELPAAEAARLLAFFGLAPARLRTRYIKTGPRELP